MRKDLHEANRLSWNAATVAHNSHKGDQAAFFREGGSTLFPEELELLGEIAGRSLLHLQCNAGQDSLSLARLGWLGICFININCHPCESEDLGQDEVGGWYRAPINTRSN